MYFLGIHSMKWDIEISILFILSAMSLSVCSLGRQETTIEALTPWSAEAHF